MHGSFSGGCALAIRDCEPQAVAKAALDACLQWRILHHTSCLRGDAPTRIGRSAELTMGWQEEVAAHARLASRVLHIDDTRNSAPRGHLCASA